MGAVREPTRSHGDPLFSMNVVSRAAGEVSREILEEIGLILHKASSKGLEKPGQSRIEHFGSLQAGEMPRPGNDHGSVVTVIRRQIIG